MSCDDVATAILEEVQPLSADLQAHLAQCPQCSELARLHASASQLRLPAPPPLAPIARQSITREVVRRHTRRQVLVGAAVASAVAAVALFFMPRSGAPEPGMEAPSVEVVELPSMDLLIEEIDGYTQRDLTIDDESYAPFGTLAVWVRPSEPTALAERPFQTALAPLHPSPTQESSR
jgi:hypothetical protein